MIKPIAVIYIPQYLELNGRQVNPFELAAGFNGDEWSRYHLNRELYGDYLWFVFPHDSNEFELQVFNAAEFTQIQYDELKNMLLKEIENIKIKTNEPK